MGRKPGRRKDWSKDEDDILIKNAGKLTPLEISMLLDRTEGAVKARAFQLEVTTSTKRLFHKGNSAVKNKDIDRAVELYKEHGTVEAAALAINERLGRMAYLIRLARLNGKLPMLRDRTKKNVPAVNYILTTNERMVFDWVKANPARKTIDCIRYFRSKGYTYYLVENCHISLRKKGWIVFNNNLWSVRYEDTEPYSSEKVEELTCKNSVNTIIQWINSQPAAKMTVEKVVEKSGYSRWHLMREFEKEKGMTIGKFLTINKLNVAARLIKEGEEDVYKISNEAGYFNPTCLSRAFKRHFGMKLNEYKNYIEMTKDRK